ncbi:unnamed protein product, partial [Prorocentrum cordatum]
MAQELTNAVNSIGHSWKTQSLEYLLAEGSAADLDFQLAVTDGDVLQVYEPAGVAKLLRDMYGNEGASSKPEFRVNGFAFHPPGPALARHHIDNVCRGISFTAKTGYGKRPPGTRVLVDCELSANVVTGRAQLRIDTT